MQPILIKIAPVTKKYYDDISLNNFYYQQTILKQHFIIETISGKPRPTIHICC